MTTALPPYPASPYPADYLTPQCEAGRTDPDWADGCPRCPAPGYMHSVLGWQARPCACKHHAKTVVAA